ncbi:MAG: hypothetical protein EOL98_08665 [Negativicutes bacterium]|nr:hypothetical protein [Negativicutes bacterium]
MSTKMMVRMALLTAAMIVAQELRLILPLPMPVTVLIIGSLLNAILVVCYRMTNLPYALMMAFLMVFVAFVQQSFWHPLIIIPALLGNIIFLAVYSACIVKGEKTYLILLLPALARGIVMGLTMIIMFNLLGFGMDQTYAANIVFGLLQTATGICGIWLSHKMFQDIEL